MVDLIEGFGLPQPSYSLAPISEADTAEKLAKWTFKLLIKHLKNNSEISTRGYSLCLVHGDTVSTLVCALIAKRHNIPVAHVEAGLRSHDLFHPFPEELIRRVVSRISSVYYCSSSSASENIIRQRPGANIINTEQNTLLDSVRLAAKNNRKRENRDSAPYCIASIHRFENISRRERLSFILDTIRNISKQIAVRFVLHSATREKLLHFGLMEILESEENIKIIPRMGYFDFISMVQFARFLVTDGGSNQEECSYLQTPCLLMRMHTERDEGIGETTTLSKYDPTIIASFLDKHKDCQPSTSFNQELKTKPSTTIALDIQSRLKTDHKNLKTKIFKKSPSPKNNFRDE